MNSNSASGPGIGGMNYINAKGRVIVAVLALLGIIILWRPINIQYHRRAMRLLSPSQEGGAAWLGHQQTLVALGHFQKRDFVLQHRMLTNNSDLMRLVDAAAFRDRQWQIEMSSNRVSVIAYRGDMPLWEKIIARFDRAEPAGAVNRSE